MRESIFNYLSAFKMDLRVRGDDKGSGILMHSYKDVAHGKLKSRHPGYWRHKVVIKKDFDKLPKYLLAAFNARQKIKEI